MFPLSHSSPFVEPTHRGLADSPAIHIGQVDKVRALEAEICALQGLVCHLLEKNEYLRMRLQMSQRTDSGEGLSFSSTKDRGLYSLGNSSRCQPKIAASTDQTPGPNIAIDSAIATERIVSSRRPAP